MSDRTYTTFGEMQREIQRLNAELERLREAFDRELRENVADEVGEKLVELRQRAEEAEAEVERLRNQLASRDDWDIARNVELTDLRQRAEAAEAALATSRELGDIMRTKLAEAQQREARLREIAKLGNYTGTSILEIKRLLGLDTAVSSKP